jgi:hypothetical protein
MELKQLSDFDEMDILLVRPILGFYVLMAFSSFDR